MDHLEFFIEKNRLDAEKNAKAVPLIVTPPESLKGALTIPEKNGLSNVPERILKAMTMPTFGNLHPKFCKVIMDDCKAGLQYAFQKRTK